MKLVQLLLPFLVLWADVPLARGNSESKFVLTAHKVFAPENTETIWLDIRENPKNSDFKIRLLEEKNYKHYNELHSVVLKNAQAKLHEIKFPVPSTAEYFGKLQVFYDDDKNLSSKVDFYKPRYATIVEADKRFYKPGELVRFRILQTKDDFLPNTDQPIQKVWITNPERIATAIWTDVKCKNGLVQLEFQLPSEPTRGTWTITVQTKNEIEHTTRTSFKVTEYVLPRFQFTVQSPDDFKFVNDKLEWKICAKYPFGKAVNGSVKAVFENSFWPPSKTNVVANLSGTPRISDGCLEFELTRADFEKYETPVNIELIGVSIDATIEEEGTGETYQIYQESFSKLVRFDWSQQTQFYHPFIPYRGEFTLRKTNLVPVPNADIELVAIGEGLEERPKVVNAKTDRNGKVYYTIIAGDSKKEIIVRAKCKRTTQHLCEGSFTEAKISPWISSSNSHIEINSMKNAVCNENLVAEVMFTFDSSAEGKSIDFNYIVESGGKIAKRGLKRAKAEAMRYPPLENLLYKANFTPKESEISVGKVALEVLAEARFAPEMKLIVFFVRDDKEVVATSRKIAIPNCSLNQVSANFSKASAEPGQPVTLSVRASADSLCALKAADKAVDFLDQTYIWKKSVYPSTRFLNEYVVKICDKTKYVISWPGFRPPPMEFGNAKRAFEQSGVLILSTLEHNMKLCAFGDAREQCDEGDCHLDNVPDYFSAPQSRIYQVNEMRETPEVNELWLWQLEDVRANETKNLQLQTPSSVTDWVLHTVCVSKTDGMGRAPPTTLRVTKPFFMDFFLPYSVKRGEIVHLKVSLFNQHNRDLPMKITFGSFTGGKLRGQKTASACLLADEQFVHEFELEAKVIGKHNITAWAEFDTGIADCGSDETMQIRDEVTEPILVEPDGIPDEDKRSRFFCFEKQVTSKREDSWDFKLPENTIPGSERLEVAVIGDLIGLTEEDLDIIIDYPMGSYEDMIMSQFAQSVLILKHLMMNGGNSWRKEEALRKIGEGYKKAQKHRHDDGSYFGFVYKPDKNSSIWLTAFAVQTISQARELIDVDEEDLKESVDWLVSRQQQDGCFEAIGEIFQQPGFFESPEGLASYILAALAESNLVENDEVFEKGLDCLTKTHPDDIFTRVVATYAQQTISRLLKKEESANETLDDLIRRATKDGDGDIFWQSDCPNTGNGACVLRPYNLDLHLQLTAYATLTLLRSGGTAYASHAFSANRWITKQFRKKTSTPAFRRQDTIVPLEALTKFVATQPRGPVHLEISAGPEDRDQVFFKVDSANKQTLQQKDLGSVPRNLQWLAKGHGCCLIQSTIRYSLENSTEPSQETQDDVAIDDFN